jgi:hypothetical protein
MIFHILNKTYEKKIMTTAFEDIYSYAKGFEIIPVASMFFPVIKSTGI